MMRLVRGRQLDPRAAASEIAIGEAQSVIEPRKLTSLVLSTLKHGSNITPRTDAHTEVGFTFTVPAGRLTKRIGPVPPILIVPKTEPSGRIRPSPLVPSKQV
jgi:hypothetical protein